MFAHYYTFFHQITPGSTPFAYDKSSDARLHFIVRGTLPIGSFLAVDLDTVIVLALAGLFRD